MKGKKGILVGILLALVLVLIPVVPAFAIDYGEVIVTAVPSYISIENAPPAWTINGIGSGAPGVIEPDKVYYACGGSAVNDITPPSAEVADTECYFTVTNASSVDIDLTVTCGAFAGGGADMTNSDDIGANGDLTYGMFCWYEGCTYATGKVVVKSSESDPMITNVAPATTELDWGVEIETRVTPWTSGAESTTGEGEKLTITATPSGGA